MSFPNSDKFKYNYELYNKYLKYNHHAKDLGIIFDPELDFKEHINYLINKAKKALFLVKFHTKNFQDVESIIHLYNSLVKSKLMYGSLIWNTDIAALEYELEKIQNQFLRYLSFKIHEPMHYYNHNYKFIQQRFNIVPLKVARKQHDLIFLHNLLNNKINSPELLSQIMFHAPLRYLRNRNSLFYIPNINLKHKSSLNRIMNLTNDNNEWIDLFVPFFSSKKSLKINLV